MRTSQHGTKNVRNVAGLNPHYLSHKYNAYFFLNPSVLHVAFIIMLVEIFWCVNLNLNGF